MPIGICSNEREKIRQGDEFAKQSVTYYIPWREYNEEYNIPREQ